MARTAGFGRPARNDRGQSTKTAGKTETTSTKLTMMSVPVKMPKAWIAGSSETPSA